MTDDLDTFFSLEPQELTTEEKEAIGDEFKFRETIIRDNKQIKLALNYSLKSIEELKKIQVSQGTDIAVVKERASLLALIAGTFSGVLTGLFGPR